MRKPPEAQSQNEALWRHTLTSGHPMDGLFFWLWSRLPTDPRCKQCHVPFGGLGGRVARLMGYRPSRRNPYMCDT